MSWENILLAKVVGASLQALPGKTIRKITDIQLGVKTIKKGQGGTVKLEKGNRTGAEMVVEVELKKGERERGKVMVKKKVLDAIL